MSKINDEWLSSQGFINHYLDKKNKIVHNITENKKLFFLKQVAREINTTSITTTEKDF